MSVYKELNDKEWLQYNYEECSRSMMSISKDLGCNHNSVRQALIKHGFKIRNCSEAQIINSKTDLKINKSVLDGSLMGDAFFHKWKKGAKSLPALQKKNKYFDHLEWFAKQFEDEPKIEFVEQFLKKTEKTYTYYTYRTGVDVKLQEYYTRWYPEWNNYKKVIPDDIDVDETFLLHWFLDDGCSHLRNRKNEFDKKGWSQHKRQVTIFLASECFDLDSQQLLCDKINDKYDLKISPKKIVWKNSKVDMEGYRCFVPQSNSDKFFEILGSCPVKSLEYKWK